MAQSVCNSRVTNKNADIINVPKKYFNPYNGNGEQFFVDFGLKNAHEINQTTFSESQIIISLYPETSLPEFIFKYKLISRPSWLVIKIARHVRRKGRLE